MSHDNQPQDRIELQRYFSENGSIASAPNGKMSASGSFTGSSIAASSVVPHTDADDQTNPTYFSIPEAQSQHQQYTAAQPTSASHRSSSAHEGSETPYDFIPDSKHKGMAYPAGVTMQADNILYEQASSNLHHQTLTMDKQQYKGSVTLDPMDYHKEGSGCRRACQVLLVSLLCVLLVVALVAGVLSLAIIFTGFVDICDKCGVSDSSMAQVVEQLRAEIQMLEMRLEALEPTTSLPPTVPTASVTTPQGMSTAPVSMTTAPATMTTPTSPFMEGVVTLREVNLFQNCTTSVERTCNIAAGEGTGVCITRPAVSLNIPGEYVLNMNCLRAAETLEPNPLIGTLDIFDNTAVCLCYVPDLDAVGTRLHNVMCGIQVTRCVSPVDIIATVAGDEL